MAHVAEAAYSDAEAVPASAWSVMREHGRE